MKNYNFLILKEGKTFGYSICASSIYEAKARAKAKGIIIKAW